MPLIPQDTKRIPIEGKGPAEVQNPEWFAATGHAIAQAGAVGGKIGEKLNELDVRLATIKNANDFIAARNAVKDSTLKLNMEMDGKIDYQNFSDYVSKYQEETGKVLQEKYGQSPVWNKIAPLMQVEFDKQQIGVNHYGRKLQIGESKAEWKNNMLTTFPNWVANSSSPEEAATYISNAEAYNKSMLEIGAITPIEAEEGTRLLKSKSSLLALKNDTRISPDLAEERLTSERDKFYPNLTPQDEYNGTLAIEKRRNEIDRQEAQSQREALKAQKEVQNQNAVEASNQMQLFIKGKNPQFENWLDQQWSMNALSDSVYRTYSDKVFRQNEKWETKMSLNKWKAFNSIEQEILKDHSTIEDEADLYSRREFQALPDAKQNSLMAMVGKKVPVKNAIRRGNKVIEDSFQLSGYMPDEKDQTRQLFRDSIDGVEDVDKIMEKARKIAGDVTAGTSQLKTTGTEAAKTKGKEAPKAKVLTYDPATGIFK